MFNLIGFKKRKMCKLKSLKDFIHGNGGKDLKFKGEVRQFKMSRIHIKGLIPHNHQKKLPQQRYMAEWNLEISQ